MMNNYLAKSNPKETIVQHTEKLISNYELIKKIYPNLEVDWDILYLACLYHDLGKMNRKFQDKIERIKRHKDEIPHGILSLAFIDPKKLEAEGYSKDRIKILTHSIAYHHERDFGNITKEDLNAEIELLKLEIENFKFNRLEVNSVKKISVKYFNFNRIDEEDEKFFFKYVMVKGLLNRIDYGASGGIEVEKENDFLLESLEKNLKYQWNELQEFMIKNRDENLIVTAQTGMGKTEAGFLWIGDNKGFFTLPLKTAINAMYKRVTDEIIIENYENKVGLLHSDIKREYMNKLDDYNKENGKEEIDFDEYYDKTKQMSLPITICTIDQIFGFVYRYRGFEPKLATLAYSKIVIDEVQMYSADLLAYLVIGISYINKIGGKFLILTATLPPLFTDLLRKEGVDFKEATFTNDKIRHSLKVIEDKINIEFIKEKYDENKILVICNTVGEAQRIYDALSKDEAIRKNLNLFHSGFIKSDRKKKEENILEFGRKDNKKCGIWVTTQVVEASLDIDFDILITELSDLNGLFQRMGRCYRSRDWQGKGYNCYVFNGGSKKTSGIGSIIDERIFKDSKRALRDIDGIISENKKIELINEVYTTSNLKDSKYYEELLDAIKYVTLINANEKSKSEVEKMFRNIESKDFIPKSVYEENEERISNLIELLKEEYPKEASEVSRKKLKRKKLEARIELYDYTLPVDVKRVEREQVKSIEISDYERIGILDCLYDKDLGISLKSKKDLKNQTIKTEDKFF